MAKNPPPAISGFFKEPFVQFLLIGAAIFAASYLFAPLPPEVADRQIAIERQVVQSMRNRLLKQLGDQVPEEELERRLGNELELKIREEILYREGLDRGLDKDDAVVKTRVAMMMERFARELASGEPFTDAEIENYYNANKKLFTKPKRISFGQVLFSSKKRGKAQALADCQAALARIQSGELTDYAELEKLGDQEPPVRGAYRGVTPERVEGILGKAFIRDLGEADRPGVVAPVESKYGYHIVQLREVVPAELKPLDEVRGRIVQKLEYDRNTASFESFYENAKGKYTVVVEDGR
jgi:parvulin-like peptidyl-prolyl isomerase